MNGLFSICLLFIFGSLPLINFQLPLSHWFQQKKQGVSYENQKKLEVSHPVSKDQKFVVFLFADGCEKTVERSLDSIFNQTHPNFRIVVVDKSRSERLSQQIESYVTAHPKKKQINLQYHQSSCSEIESVYRVLQDAPGSEIAIFMDGTDWLSHEFVFDHLNRAYANPDVWMTYSKMVTYPDFQSVRGECFPDTFFEEKKLRHEREIALSGLKTFYVALFHQIKLQDLLYKGAFIEDRVQEGLFFPMAEMAGKHILFLDEIAYVANNAVSKELSKSDLHKRMEVEEFLRALPSYNTFHMQLERGVSSRQREYEGDVIIISQDHPLHLYACLESLQEKVKNINEVFVLYHSSDSELERAYLIVKKEFSRVRFLDLCDYPGNEFDALFNRALAGKRYSSPYVLIMEDHTLFKDRVVLNDCISWMERLHCDRFLLSEDGAALASHPIYFSQSVSAAQFGDFATDIQFGISLCHKNVFDHNKGVTIKSLVSLKKLWKQGFVPQSVALFCKESPVFLLEREEVKERLKKERAQLVINGYKIDLSSFPFEQDQIEKGEYPLILRDRWKRN